MKSRNRAGDKAEPWGTRLQKRKKEDIFPSTTVDMKLFERKLDKVSAKEGEIVGHERVQYRSNVFDMSNATTEHYP